MRAVLLARPVLVASRCPKRKQATIQIALTSSHSVILHLHASVTALLLARLVTLASVVVRVLIDITVCSSYAKRVRTQAGC